MIKIFIISLVASLLNLDNSLIGNFMVSRPIVVGPLIGIILGDIKIGLQIGIYFEFLFADILYAGTAIPINLTLFTALVLGTIYALPIYGAEIYMFVILIAFPIVFILRQVETGLRILNSNFATNVEKKVKIGNYCSITKNMFYGNFIFFVTNFLLLFCCIFLTAAIAKVLFYSLPQAMIYALKNTYDLLPILGLVIMINVFTQKLKFF